MMVVPEIHLRLSSHIWSLEKRIDKRAYPNHDGVLSLDNLLRRIQFKLRT
jgi:hypothetical protein